TTLLPSLLSFILLFSSISPPPPRSTLFPYTTLFRSNVYLPDDLAAAVRDAQVPVSAVCQSALERAVRDVASLRATDEPPPEDSRSEEHTSELQSRFDLVCRLLLEKKKKKKTHNK